MSRTLPVAIAKRHKLSPKLTRFVEALLNENGDVPKAVMAMGYTGKNPRAEGSRLWRSDGVQEAYKAAIWDKLAIGAGSAAKSLIDLANSAESEHARIMAAKEVIGLAGYQQQQQATGGAVTINIGLNTGTSDQGAIKHVADIEQSPASIDLQALRDGDS